MNGAGVKRPFDEEDCTVEKKLKNGVLNDFLIPKLVPSLQHAASVEICVIFWKSEQFVDLFTQYLRNIHTQTFWKLIDAAAATFIQQLEVPVLVKEKLEYFCRGTGDEILSWRDHNPWIKISRSFTDNLKLKSIVRRCVNCMVWTNRGLIDYEATARNLCNGDFLPRAQRFQLATLYCLEDVLREKFQPELKKHREKFGSTTILSHWAVITRSNFLYQSRRRGNLYGTCSMNDYMHYFVNAMNDEARKYFLDKLDVVHKEKLIRNILNLYDLSIGLKLYWLSKITLKKRKAALLNKSPLMILSGSVLWEDVMTFYFQTFGPRFTGIFCALLIINLFREYFSFGTLQQARYYSYINILWNCITDYAKKYVILAYRSGIAGIYSLTCLVHLFEALVRSNDQHFLKEFFSILNGQCSTDEISRKRYRLCDNYVPKYNNRSKYFNWRIYLVFEFLTLSTFSPIGNPLMYRSIQDDIHDVFVEICLSRKTYEIENILRVHFKSDIIAMETYRSTLIRPIFIKLRNIEVENCKYWNQNEIFPATDFFLDFCFNECDELINKFKREMEYEGIST